MTINVTYAVPMMALVIEDDQDNIYARIFPHPEGQMPDNGGLLLTARKESYDVWMRVSGEEALDIDGELSKGLSAHYEALVASGVPFKVVPNKQQ